MASDGHLRVKASGAWVFPIKTYTKLSGSWVLTKAFGKATGTWFEHGLQPITTTNRVWQPFSTTGNTNYHGNSVQSVSLSAGPNQIIQGLQIGHRVNKGSDDDNDFNTRQIRARILTADLIADDWQQAIPIDGSEVLLATFNIGLSSGTSVGTADAGTSRDEFMPTRIVVRHAVQTLSTGGDDDFEGTRAAFGIDIFGKTSSVFKDVRYVSDTIFDASNSGNPQGSFLDSGQQDVGATNMIRKIEFGGSHSRTGDDDDIGALSSVITLKLTANNINVALL